MGIDRHHVNDTLTLLTAMLNVALDDEALDNLTHHVSDVIDAHLTPDSRPDVPVVPDEDQYCDHCGDLLGDDRFHISESPIPLTSVNEGESAVLCPPCHHFVSHTGKWKPDTTLWLLAVTPERALYDDFNRHRGHDVVIAGYSANHPDHHPDNLAIECETCMVVLIDVDRPEGVIANDKQQLAKSDQARCALCNEVFRIEDLTDAMLCRTCHS